MTKKLELESQDMQSNADFDNADAPSCESLRVIMRREDEDGLQLSDELTEERVIPTYAPPERSCCEIYYDQEGGS